MKKVLITGKNSYIGNSLENWLMREPDKYQINKISLRNNSWKETDLSHYDVVYHVTGIAHRKETKKNRELYYKVNRDQAYEMAQKSKVAGVSQFIFLSSMSVYGLESGVIDESTPMNPKTAYGKSKLEAEKLIQTLQNDNFKVAIIRPPMVYGKGCKGNYSRLAKLALKTPIFPKVNNRRSMIYIDNLSEFVKQIINDCGRGIFFPQNAEYTNTSEMVQLIAETHQKRMEMTKSFNPILRLLNTSTVNKVFGDLVYEMSLSVYVNNYIVCRFEDSIQMTEAQK